MADYNFDEVKRKEKEKIEKKISGDWPKSVQIGKEKTKTLELDINDDLFLRVAKEAHVRDITFNKMVNIMWKGALKEAQYRFEHDSRPQLLNEDK